MNRFQKILVGLATIWPLIYVILVSIVLVSFFFLPAILTSLSVTQEPGLLLGRIMVGLVFFHVSTFVWSVGLLTFYVIHAARNPQLTEETRILWMLLIFLGNLTTMPLYWYLYFWKTPRRRSR